MMFLGNSKKQKEFNTEVNLAICIELERFGFANAEHFKSYADLSKVAESKINPQYADNNYHQQSGFSAEIKTEARINAENIINDSDKRIKRTDKIGNVNHPKFDHVDVDKNGNPILNNDGTFKGGSQQKVHINIETYDKYSKPELYEKYQGAPIDVPTNQLEEIKQRYANTIENLQQQEAKLRQSGKIELANEKNAEITRAKDVRNRFRDSKVSTDEAMEARKNPALSVGKDIADISHKAGVEASKMGASIGGGLSLLKNIFLVIKGESDTYNATKNVIIDTGKSAAVSYATGASSSAIQGALKASGSQITQNLAKGNTPTLIIQTSIIIVQYTKKLVAGKITPLEFAKHMGQESTTLATSITGANLGAIVGTLIVPGVGTIVGGVIGGMVASIMSSAVYSELQKSIHDLELSNQQREMIRQYCQSLIKQEKEYREYTMSIFDKYFDNKEFEIRNGFENVSLAFQNGTDINQGLSMIGQAFNINLQFDNAQGFKNFVKSDQVLRL
ncbi:MAG: hypothetical protein V2A75_04120 [Pseudomonadota bacterium]